MECERHDTVTDMKIEDRQKRTSRIRVQTWQGNLHHGKEELQGDKAGEKFRHRREQGARVGKSGGRRGIHCLSMRPCARSRMPSTFNAKLVFRIPF